MTAMHEALSERGRRKALFVVPMDTYGGAERVLATTARALSRSGEWSVEIAAIAAQNDTNFVAGGCGDARMTYGRGGGGLASEWRLSPRLIGRRFDLVFSTHVRVNAALSLARRTGLLKTARLVTRESTVLNDRAAGARLLVYRSLYNLYGAQDLIVAQTSYMADRVKALLPRRAWSAVQVISNPLDRAAIDKDLRVPLEPPLAQKLAEAPHIVWCGRLVGVKNPLRALETLMQARRKTGSDLRLAIVGAGPLATDMQAAIAANGLQPYVTLLGDRPNPYPVMAACPLGLVTSDTEGFPNVILEMMACGVERIVTTPCAGDLDKLPGVLVSASFEASALADALASAALSGADRLNAYEATLRERSLQTFIARLLGEPGATTR